MIFHDADESKDRKDRAVSVKIGTEDNSITYKLTKLRSLDDTYQFTIERTLDGESYGNKFESFIDKDHVDTIRRLLAYADDLESM